MHKKNQSKIQLRSLLAAALLATAGLTGTAQASSHPDVMVGMPNPMVEYGSVRDAARAAGFTPLYLPALSGYHVRFVYVIDKTTIDIGYTRDGNTNTTLRLRTARSSSLQTRDISGIYSVEWKDKTLDDIPVAIAKVPALSKENRDGYAAHWSVDGWLFSVSAEQIAQPEFLHLLQDGLIDLSRHYY